MEQSGRTGSDPILESYRREIKKTTRPQFPALGDIYTRQILNPVFSIWTTIKADVLQKFLKIVKG